jgi:hypothetical protein
MPPHVDGNAEDHRIQPETHPPGLPALDNDQAFSIMTKCPSGELTIRPWEVDYSLGLGFLEQTFIFRCQSNWKEG